MIERIDEEVWTRLTANVARLSAGPSPSLGALTDKMLHGTTIGAILVEGGQKVVVFSDGKVSMGNKPVSLVYRKIMSVDQFTRLLISGSPGISMEYAAILKSWIGYSEDTNNRLMTARAKVRALARLLLGGIGLAGAGIVCSPILATYDALEKRRARIWSLGFDGSEVEYTDCTADGSGGNVDIFLHERWRPEFTEDEGIRLAREAIEVKISHIDSFSGGKVSIDVIGPDGIRLVS